MFNLGSSLVVDPKPPPVDAAPKPPPVDAPPKPPPIDEPPKPPPDELPKPAGKKTGIGAHTF